VFSPESASTRPVASLALAARRAAADELDLLIDDLRAWVAIDSTSGDTEAVARTARVIAERLDAYGIPAELRPTPAGPLLRAAVQGRGASRVALLCHHDTVFDRGTVAQRPFLIAGGCATGPGVADMKGGIAVAVHALRLLAGRLDAVGRVELVSTPDEELRADPFPGIEALEGFDAVLCMECGRPGNGIVTRRKGAHWLTVDASGRAAHAGVAATSGRSALLAACREALRLSALDGARDGLGVHVTTLHAGEILNSVASSATFNVDLRAWHDADLDWALAQAARFGQHDGVELRLAATQRVPALERTDAVARLAGMAAAVAEELGTPISEVSTGGVSDASWTAAAGIPSIDGLGPIGQDDHTPDERIEVASLADRCALVCGLAGAVEARRPRPEAHDIPEAERR
jgi:glutamate carboxypeptidase